MSVLGVNEHPAERVARVVLGLLVIALAAVGTIPAMKSRLHRARMRLAARRQCEQFGAGFSRLLQAMRSQMAEPEPVGGDVLDRLRAALGGA